MSIQFTCENCQKNLKVPESAAGKRGRCNQCGHLNTIPAASPAELVSDVVASDPAPQPIGSGGAAATYNVKSAVNGAVFGPADEATLQGWLGEGRITPNCQLQQTGSQNWTPASAMFPALGAAAGVAASATASSSGDAYSEFKQSFESPKKQGELNPYAPALSPHVPGSGHNVSREIVPTSGDIGFCISHGWKTWTENFGLLLAVSATTIGVNYAFQFLQGMVQVGLGAAGDMWLMGIGVAVVVLISLVVQAWLGLGATKLICQLCRGERAEYATLFGNGGRVPLLLLLGFLFYLPFFVVFGGAFLFIGPDGLQGPGAGEAGVALGITMLVTLAVFFILMLTVWPIYFMLADTKLGFGELVSKGFKVGLKNCLIAIPVFFVAFLVAMMGIFACFIGLIATVPAGQAIMATAYLNMSGQLKPR